MKAGESDMQHVKPSIQPLVQREGRERHVKPSIYPTPSTERGTRKARVIIGPHRKLRKARCVKLGLKVRLWSLINLTLKWQNDVRLF